MVNHGAADKLSSSATPQGHPVEPDTDMASKSEKKGITRGNQSALAFKVSHILVSLFLMWLLAIHTLGLYFFAKGFLLTRLILDNKSDCATLPDGSPSTAGTGCWHPRTFDRAVVIVIDALRYDFTVPFHPATVESQPSYYHDAFPVLHEIAVKNPANAFLLPFIADPPTTTLQRLKGLTTGTLPTFIDAGTNFAGTAIEEDNLLSQLRQAGKTLVHLGDDTWQSLFPGYFDVNMSRAYDSFNVWDLHTLDNGVIEHIMPLLNSTGSRSWDVIFAHFLGVDHAGHRYGPNHAAMNAKLRQMDNVIRDVISVIDEQTLLVVMGDHGMDPKGDHGGESDDEVEAALWMYSKRARFGRTQPAFREPPRTAKERPVRQIDLASTLSLLLGTPIPFNNLGAPIDEAFAGPGKADWRNLAAVNRLSFEQIQTYQEHYSRIKDLEPVHEQYQKYLAVQKILKENGLKDWEVCYRACRDWQVETLSRFRSLWANFSIPDMIHGVEILAAALVTLLILARSIRDDLTNYMPNLLRCIGLGIGGGATVGPLLNKFLPQTFTGINGVLYGMSMGGILASGFFLYQHRHLLVLPFSQSAWGGLGFAFTISQAVGFASNSYTIHEDTILLFFLSTFGVIACLSSSRQIFSSDRVLGMYHSALFVLHTRFVSFSRLCREEQMPGCRSTFYASSTSSTSAPWQLFIPYAIALILPEIIKAFYKGTASYEASAGFWIGFCFRMGLLIVAAFWTIDAASNAGWLADTISEERLKTISMALSRSALAVALPIGLATYIWAKPCVNIFFTEPRKPSEDSPSTLATRPQLTILGFANAHGTRYFLLLPVFVLSITLLLPPMGQLAMAICTWQILCLLEILDTNGLIISSSPGSAIGPVVLAMLGSYHFFKTGHQAVLSSIQWNAAYVPLRTIIYPWSPILMVLNTFGPQILCALAVPLTVLWKRPFSKRGLRGIIGDVTQAMLTHVLYYATMQLATTMWAGHLRRHLMLYRVFMPRFLMASVLLIIVDLTLIFIALPALRVSSLSVGEIFGY